MKTHLVLVFLGVFNNFYSWLLIYNNEIVKIHDGILNYSSPEPTNSILINFQDVVKRVDVRMI